MNILSQIEARRVDNNTFDLFFGKQWGDHARVRKGRMGVYRLSGIRVDHETLKQLDAILAPNMPITYGQDLGTMFHNNMAIQ